MSLVSTEMSADIGLEVRNSENLELRWKLVKRGRSSRKSSRRSLNPVGNLIRSSSPRRVRDFSKPDSNKFHEVILDQSKSGKLESIPIKKRRHLLSEDNISQCPSPSFEDNRQHNFPQLSSGDFSGIELLAAAASMDNVDDDSSNEIHVKKSSEWDPKTADTSSAVLPPETFLKSSDLEKFSCGMTGKAGDIGLSLVLIDPASASGSLCRSTEIGLLNKSVDRKHWDLNILMDAWDEPCTSMAGSKVLNDNAFAGPTRTKVDEGNSVIISLDRTCNKEALHGSYSDVITPNNDIEATHNGSVGIGYQSPSDSHDSQVHSVTVDGKHNFSLFPKPCCTSVVSDGKVKSSSVDSCNLCDSERSCMRDKSLSPILTPISYGMTGPSDTQCQDSKGSAGNVQDAQSLLCSDSRNQIDRPCTTASAEAGSHDPSLPADFEPDQGDENNQFEDSSSSYNCGGLDDPRNSYGVLDSTKNTHNFLYVSQDQHIPVFQEDNLTAVKEGGSPYEDGELRAPCMYSWEENECVDYESDEKSEDENDVDDCRTSDFAGNVSDLAHGIQSRNLMAKGYSEADESNCGPVEPSLINNPSQDNGGNDKIEGKGSNAGSGITVDQPMEIVEENGESKKRRELFGCGYDAKMRETTECASYASKGKLRWGVERRPLVDVGGINGSAFPPLSRSHQHSILYSRHERDISPGKHTGRHRSSHGVTGGAHWESWSLRRYHISEHQPSKLHGSNRSRIVSDGVGERYSSKELLDSRETDNSKGFQRSASQRSSFEREDYVSSRRRMPFRRGVGIFMNKGNYLHQSDRGFDDFSKHCDDDNGIQFPRPSSSRSQNFSQHSLRILPGRRSHSTSRSPSPRAWYPHREQTMGRKHTRSPDYRLDVRMKRPRAPCMKSAYDEGGYMPASKGRVSLEDSCGYTEYSAFSSMHLKQRRSRVRDSGRSRRLDAIHSPAWLKADEYNRSGNRPRRVTVSASGKGDKSESDCYDRKRDGRVGIIR